MLKFYYQWRYNRAQRDSSFEVPGESRRPQINLGSYLSQDTVRGRHFDRFDLPRKRRAWLKWCFLIAVVILLIWVVFESIQAFSLMQN